MRRKTILEYETVSFDPEKRALVIIDQTLLPGQVRLLSLTEIEDIWEAIYLLKVRGAPAIGVAAAIGLYVAAEQIDTVDEELFYQQFKEKKKYLETARPTAVNLFWALEKMEAVVKKNRGKGVGEIKKLLNREAMQIHDEDIEVCRRIGEYGLKLLNSGDGILTHCNAGKLAAVKYGTATAPMYLGQERGYGFHIYVDETRPLLQGARLTAFELAAAGMDVTLICDNMAADIMKKRLVQAVFVGCDRVASNGDAANKIGTSGVAALASYYRIPFYICAPTSTIDMTLKSGSEIPIEERKETEITEMWYEKRMAPENIKVYNPCFDVTEKELITGIVTEYGVAYPPYEESLRRIFEKKFE
ncbi:S-methyl-5-thioribose-1-phosphate isomerase [Mediterraneibacter sp. NSJ-55]|uniref:Methylthioribose-1-phosphate isomerase n=1 Tax=Mediterraneibacter hominis TaxID=2763054 RepID=A0A923LLH1_9FIRM|nr:S-methyl-5-thioribose-1-phosphate isomerase [Mediterraneibacter hominis]MBC5690503.1 S-methyl-5-thioribose-1-phosphate isomerase [Mediterraneibacter hominis]